MDTVPPLVFSREQDPQDLSENRSEEQKSCTNSHSLDIERSLFFREKSRTGNRAGLTHHTKYDQTCASFGGRTLIVSHPGEGESHSGEDAAANQVGGEISYSARLDNGLNQVSNCAYCAQCTEEVRPVLDLVR